MAEAMRWNEFDAECLVYVYRAGLLSAFGHDLELRVGRFTIEADEAARRGEARFDVASLRVVGAVRGGTVDPGALASDDRREIERTIGAVLDAAAYPEIRFVASRVEEDGRDFVVSGDLTIRGVTRAIAARARPADGRYLTEVRLHQPDFGIRPYSAFAGALRIEPDVLVRLTAVDPR